jgi:hypothetical protein
MKLFLMRHGHAIAAEKDRPLTEQGRKEAARVGEFLCKIKEMPDVILHSGLTRSRETAEGVAVSLGFHGDLLKQDGLEPEDSVTAFMGNFRAKYDPSTPKTLFNKAYLEINDYIDCLLNFWSEVDRVYAGRTVALPVLGSGITRFRGYENISEQELLELIIWTFKVSRIKFTYPSKAKIVVYEKKKDKVNLLRLKDLEA